MRDLRAFLAEHPGAVWQLPEPLSLRHELTALQHELDRDRTALRARLDGLGRLVAASTALDRLG